MTERPENWETRWRVTDEIVVTHHAVMRSRERIGIGGQEAVNFLRRRVRRAIEQKALSSVPPGWVWGNSKVDETMKWIETSTSHKVAILLRRNQDGDPITVITVMTPHGMTT